MKFGAATFLCLTLCLTACDSDAPDAAKDSGDKAADKSEAKAAGDDAAKPEGDAEAPEKTAPAAKPKSDKPDPCGVLTEAQVRKLAEISADAALEVKPAKFMKTVCEYIWTNPGESKVWTGKLSIGVTPKPFADEAAAVAGFEKAIGSLRKEMTAGGKPPEFIDISDSGDEASWWPAMGQLSVRKGDRILYVTVPGKKPELEQRLALAKALAAAAFE